MKNGGDRVVIASPDNLFKLGIVDVDYKKLGLTDHELQECEEGKFLDTESVLDVSDDKSVIQKEVLENENILQFKNIKILTLNVCGLVSKLKNPDFIEFMCLDMM